MGKKHSAVFGEYKTHSTTYIRSIIVHIYLDLVFGPQIILPRWLTEKRRS